MDNIYFWILYLLGFSLRLGSKKLCTELLHASGIALSKSVEVDLYAATICFDFMSYPSTLYRFLDGMKKYSVQGIISLKLEKWIL